jgi:hypothetical protein
VQYLDLIFRIHLLLFSVDWISKNNGKDIFYMLVEVSFYMADPLFETSRPGDGLVSSSWGEPAVACLQSFA